MDNYRHPSLKLAFLHYHNVGTEFKTRQTRSETDKEIVVTDFKRCNSQDFKFIAMTPFILVADCLALWEKGVCWWNGADLRSGQDRQITSALPRPTIGPSVRSSVPPPAHSSSSFLELTL